MAETAAALTHFCSLVDEFLEAVGALADGDLDSLAEPELADVLVDLMGAATRVDAVIAEVAGRVDASRIWSNDGSRSCAAWLGRAAHRDRGECAGLVGRARRLRTMPLVEAAHREGRLSARHVTLLAKAAESAPEAFADDEAWLAETARDLGFAELRKELDYWRQHVVPDDEEEAAAHRRRNRRLNMSAGIHGTGVLDVEFEPVGYAEFSESLRRIERELWRADWDEARRRVGEGASARDLGRTDAQRRYDALIEMARRASAVPDGARLPRPLVTVHVDHQTLSGRICELSTGKVLTPGEVLPLLTEADLERAVFGPDGRVIELGRRSRLFVGGARRAVEVARPTCTHGTCQVPAEQCDIHHLTSWEEGGTTDPANGEPRCPPHHPGRYRRPSNRGRSGDRGSGGNRGGDGSDDEDGAS